MVIWRARRRDIAACPGHHWHPTERGWRCCGCPQQIRAGGNTAGPEQGPAVCRQTPSDESVERWLAPPAPVGPGRQPRRRRLARRAGAA